MSDDTRVALGIPIVVNTSLGAVQVRTLSAPEFIMFSNQLVNIFKLYNDEAMVLKNQAAAVQSVLMKHPNAIVGLLSGSTGLSTDDLGRLPLDEFMDLTFAFVDQHEKSIDRFFEGKRRWEDLLARTRPSRNSSTVSSPVAGPSPTSDPSASNNSNSTEGTPLFEASTIASSN